MLESTHHEGEPPDASLVYEMRRLALAGGSISDLLHCITLRIEFRPFPVALYMRLAFGVPITLLKEFVQCVKQTTSPDDLAEDPVSRHVLVEIERTRETWANRLQPSSSIAQQ